MQIIETFLRHYLREIDYYAEAGRLVQGLLQSELTRRGIRAIVTSRAKDPERLRAKLLERNTTGGKNYASLEEIYSDIVDLAGVRVALYFPGDRKKVDEVVSELFQLVCPAKVFPEGNPKPRAKGLAGYLATHYRVQLKADKLSQAQRRYAAATIEIQVASVLMHAWAEVEHDLLYKPLQGKPATDEIAVIDELNALVLAGEIALERLQRSIESRVSAEPDSRFANEFELQAFLSSKIQSTSTNQIGVVDFLYELLQHAKLDTPAALAPFLARVELSAGSEPVSDQLIDLITAEDPEKYELFLSMWRKFRDKFSSFSGLDIFPQARQDALSNFLKQWIELEKRVILLTKSSSRFLTSKVMGELLEQIPLDASSIATIQQLRNLRNQLVHGQALPNARTLNKAANEIRDLLDTKLYAPE